MQLAYKLLPVKAGQDGKKAIPNRRHRSPISLKHLPSRIVRRALTPIDIKQAASVRRRTCYTRRFSEKARPKQAHTR